MYTSPWLSDFPAESLFGSKAKLLGYRTDVHEASNPNTSSYKYIGSVVTDAYIALGTFCDDWGYLGQELLFQTVKSDSIAYWAIGENSAPTTWAFGCNQDVMFHSGKGTFGLRIDGTDDLKINGLKIENLYENSDLGSMACGEYSGSTRLDEFGMFCFVLLCFVFILFLFDFVLVWFIFNSFFCFLLCL